MSLHLWGWNVSALFYAKTYGPLAHQLDAELFHALGALEGAVVADCGCGPGVVSHKLAERGARRVFAIDVNAQMLKQIPPHPAIRVIHAPVESGVLATLHREEAPAGFDLILFKRSLYQERSAALALLREGFRALAAGGKLAIIHPEGDWRIYAFGAPRRLHRHTPYHLFNRTVSLLNAALGLGQYALRTREELLLLAKEVSPAARVTLLDSSQRAFNTVLIERPGEQA